MGRKRDDTWKIQPGGLIRFSADGLWLWGPLEAEASGYVGKQQQIS